MSRPPCPKCQGMRVFKNGSYKLSSGILKQRWFCQACRKGFIPSKVQEIPAPAFETSAARPKHGY